MQTIHFLRLGVLFCFKLPSISAKDQKIQHLLNQKFCVSGQMEYWEYMENFLSHFLEEEMDEVKSTICR